MYVNDDIDFRFKSGKIKPNYFKKKIHHHFYLPDHGGPSVTGFATTAVLIPGQNACRSFFEFNANSNETDY